jgi:hypothetical protein
VSRRLRREVNGLYDEMVLLLREAGLSKACIRAITSDLREIGKELWRYASKARRISTGYSVLPHEFRDLAVLSTRRSKKAREELALYQDLQRRLRSASQTTLRTLVEQLARRFTAEIVGNFDERVYRLSTTLIPTGLSVLLNAMSPRRSISFV